MFTFNSKIIQRFTLHVVIAVPDDYACCSVFYTKIKKKCARFVSYHNGNFRSFIFGITENCYVYLCDANYNNS